MKKVYFLLAAVLLVATAWSKTTTWTGGANTAWDNAANWDNGVPASGDHVIFPNNTSVNLTRVAFGGNLNLASLTILGNSTVRFSNSVIRTITITNGAAGDDFVIDAGADLTIGAGISLTLGSGTAGNPTSAAIDGTLIVESGRTLDADNANVLTTVGGIIQNSGWVYGHAARLSFAAGSAYIHARNGGGIPRASWDSNSTCSVEGFVNSVVSDLNQTFGNFTWNSPLQTSNFNFSGGLSTVKGNFTVANTGSGSIRLKNTGTPTTTIVQGDYIQTGGTLLLVGSSGTHTLRVNGDFTMTGGTLSRGGTPGASSNANVAFVGGVPQVFTKDPSAVISNAINFSIPTGSIVDFGTSELDGSTGAFVLSAGGKIITAHSEGLGPNGSIQMTRTFNSGADYEFQGESTGVFTTTSSNIIRDLIINNSVNGQNVVLSQPMEVSRMLVLTDGMLTTSASNLLTIRATGGASAPTPTSFVNGPLAKTGNTAFTFPVGSAGEGYRTIGITAPSVSATFRAEFVRSNPEVAALAPTITQISACEYWELDRTSGGSATARVVLSWESLSSCNGVNYVTNPATLRVAHLVGTTWVDEGNSAFTGDATSGTVTSSNAVATFSPFILASSSVLDNPLPVVFANVKAYEKNNGVQIDWSNLTEKDVAKYIVERSSNGTDFVAIGQQLPTSNQDDKADYTAFDATPLAGTNYYRIKAEETTGKIVYSKVLSVTLGVTTQSLRLYPNPVKGHQVNISLSNVRSGQYDLRVVNINGQDVYKQRVNSQGSTITQTIDLPASMAPGVYNMVVTGADYRQTKMFIVQ